MGGRVMSETIRVPWEVGRAVTSMPAAAKAKPPRSSWLARKAAQIRVDRADLEEKLARVPHGQKKRREQLQGAAAFQALRLAWAEDLATRPDGWLHARASTLEGDLGPAGVGYLDAGLPREYSTDKRLLDQLGELALVRFALEGEEEP